MGRFIRLFGGGPKKDLHEAVEDEANKKNLQSGKWYRVEAIYVHKTNPIDFYRVTLDPTPLDQPPP